MKSIHKTVLYVILTLFFTVLLGSFQQNSTYIPGWVILPQLAPGLAAWIMLGLFRGQTASLLSVPGELKIWKIAVSIGFPLGLIGVQVVLYQLVFTPFDTPLFQGTGFLIILSWMLVGAFAEELGWRGYLQPLLNQRYSGFLTSLLIGFIWGIWHVGNYQQGFAYMLFFVLSTCAYSLVITWLLKGAGWNVILPWFFHVAVNLGYYLFSAVLTETRFMFVNGLIWVAAAAIVVIFNRHLFFFSPSDQ